MVFRIGERHRMTPAVEERHGGIDVFATWRANGNTTINFQLCTERTAAFYYQHAKSWIERGRRGRRFVLLEDNYSERCNKRRDWSIMIGGFVEGSPVIVTRRDVLGDNHQISRTNSASGEKLNPCSAHKLKVKNWRKGWIRSVLRLKKTQNYGWEQMTQKMLQHLQFTFARLSLHCPYK